MFGGFKIQGRTVEGAIKILDDALAIQDAGCFMLEFEAVPAPIAARISKELEIPTIGIGAGAGTDG
jgi:3-methyl-2-oxobutanoate hydroxymethyltransferase